MTLKEQRREFYNMLEDLLGIKIPDDKLKYISSALKSYSNNTNEVYKKSIQELNIKLENKNIKIKTQDTIKKSNTINNVSKKDNIRVWTPNKL